MSLIVGYNKESKRVDEATVFGIPEPEFTRTWHPVAHQKVATAVINAVEKTGMEIVRREYSIAQKGMLCFAAYTLSNKFNGGEWMIGWRNALNKMLSVGMVAGTKITICDNLMFSGKFLEFHKHSAKMDNDLLTVLSTRAMEKTVVYLEKLGEWQGGLKEVAVNTNEFKQLSYDLMYEGAILPSQFITKFLPAYDEEKKLNGESLYSVHGAVTRTLRGSSLFSVSERSVPLNKVIDQFAREAA